ncbi:hypothetical protein ACILPN_06740 [Yersinia wautersii]|uniref:Putative bacteriophage tail sheath protein n=1 Tax=Yersinia pseudotuberculosis TaxID=633 RepID=A0A380Q3R0_YERPU|nr:putative bacteriophage tail sheath protein [Yersinia pseudotuberculosis]
MTISFKDIPDNIRVPLCYIEFDNSAAVKGTPQVLHKTLLLGLRLATGSVPAGHPFRITSASAAEDAFGRGSMLATMASGFIQANAFSDLWAIAIDDDEEGVKATGTVTLSGVCATPGQIALMIAGTQVRVTVLAGDTAAAMATKMTTAITARKTLPVTAKSTEGVVTLTANWSGVTGNDIDIRVNYYDGEMLPSGVGCTALRWLSAIRTIACGVAITLFTPKKTGFVSLSTWPLRSLTTRRYWTIADNVYGWLMQQILSVCLSAMLPQKPNSSLYTRINHVRIG